MSLLSWGKFQCKPATKYFDWSFAPKLKSDERFARQYRFVPPSEFLLTLYGSSLVQYLSGPIMNTLIQILYEKNKIGDVISFLR